MVTDVQCVNMHITGGFQYKRFVTLEEKHTLQESSAVLMLNFNLKQDYGISKSKYNQD